MAEKKNDSTTLVNFRVDPIVKESAEAVLGGMGLSVSAYVGMCLRQVAQQREIPFSPTVDADFWMAENVVSEAMSLIASGAFERAVEKAEDIEVGLGVKYLKLEVDERYGDDGNRKEGMGFYSYCNMVVDQVFSTFWGAGATFREKFDYLADAEDTAKKLWGGDAEENHARSEQIAAYAEVRKELAGMCRDFVVEIGLGEANMSDREAVEAFDRCVMVPVEAYDLYGTNFSLRFAGAGSDMDSYHLVKKSSADLAKKKDAMEKDSIAERLNRAIASSEEDGGE